MQKHPWCRDEGHDDRWCSTCDILWDGTEYGEGRYDELAAENKQQAKRIEQLTSRLMQADSLLKWWVETDACESCDLVDETNKYFQEHSKGGKDVDKG